MSAARLSMRCRFALGAWVAGTGLALPAFAAPEAPGARTGDDALTCEQLATELMPYIVQMRAGVQALATSQQQLGTQALSTLEQRRLEHQLLAPLATAGALDPTGASKRAYVAAAAAQAAKEAAESEAAASSPLAQHATSQSEKLAAQGQVMQGDARLQQLMRLARQKECGRQ
jgi:hypothetical protein